MVQISALLIVDFTSILQSAIITGIGTMLTLYLGLKVERKRVKREEADAKLKEIKIFHDSLTANEVRSMHEHIPFFIMNDFSEPDDFFARDRNEFKVQYPSNVIPFPQLSANIVIDELSVREFKNLMDREWKAIADTDETEIEIEPGYAICKHCYRQIKGSVHAEGMNRGKMRCDPEDTLGGYGYNAEATGVECGTTCLGHK